MNLFLDCEFNGHGGELISLALAAPDGKHWYGIWPLALDKLNPWVTQNVVPVLNAMPTTLELETGEQFTAETLRFSLHEYLHFRSGAIVYADWPDDFAHLMRIMSGPSYEKSWIVDIGMQLLIGTDPKPEIPHNALSDAIALMHWCKANTGRHPLPGKS